MTTPRKPTLDPSKSRQERAGILLDAAMESIAQQIKTGPISASVLHEAHMLAKACGLELSQDGQPLSKAGDAVLESLADIDPSIFENIDYRQ